MLPTGATDLPLDPSAPRTARVFVTHALASWGLEALVDAVVLLTSELVTNSLLHAASPAVLTITRTASGVRLGVSDSSRVGPVTRDRGEEATNGRGLRLLDDLADEWGWETTPTGKTIWFLVHEGSDPWPSGQERP